MKYVGVDLHNQIIVLCLVVVVGGRRQVAGQRVSNEPESGALKRAPGAGFFLLHQQGRCMKQDCRPGKVKGPCTSPPNDAWIFAQHVLGTPIPSAASERGAGADFRHLISPKKVAPSPPQFCRGGTLCR